METKKGITKLVVGLIIAAIAVGVFALAIVTTQTTSKSESSKEDATTTLNCQQIAEEDGYTTTADISITYVNDLAKVILMKETDVKEGGISDDEFDLVKSLADESYSSWDVQRIDENTLVINAELKTDSEAAKEVQHYDEAKSMFEERGFACK